MKIGAFIFDLGKGGAQGVFVSLVNYLTLKGYSTDVIVQNLNDQIRLEELDPETHVINLNANSAKKLLPKLIRYFKNNKVDTAIAFSPEIAINLYFAKRILHMSNMKIIGRNINTLSVEFEYTDSLFRKYISSTLIKLFFHKIDYVVAQSQGMAEDLLDSFSFKKEQLAVINNPLAKKYEIELNTKAEIHRDNYILFVGRLEKQKGIDNLIYAFSQISDKSILLYIVGSGSLKEDLLCLSEKYKVSKRVVFIDFTLSVIQYYKKAKLVVLTSYYEGFPNVLIEAISCGTPVVSYDMPSGAKDIIDLTNGILVDYLNVHDLIVAINNGLKKQWDYESVKNSAEKFRETTIMEKYIDLIERLQE